MDWRSFKGVWGSFWVDIEAGFELIHVRITWLKWWVLGCSGDLVRKLRNRPCRASYGLLSGLIGHTEWTY